MDHFNQLTPAEAERLAYLLEELGEAQQAIGKILRHGYESTHPAGGPTNRVLLENELGDIVKALILMKSDLNLTRIWSSQPGPKLFRYLHHQKEIFVGDSFQ